jgi:anti-sigma regulatory factor (Ser/Thr protein kinase)
MKKEFSLNHYTSKQAFLKEALSYSEEALKKLLQQAEATVKPLLCIEEVLTNIINHSNIADSGQIILSLNLKSDNSLVIEIEDQGEHFDISQYPLDAPRKDIGGAGIRLIRSFMHVAYHQKSGWNVVSLTKKF